MNIHSIVTIACGACSSANLTKPQTQVLERKCHTKVVTWYMLLEMK